jgi:hypothetical protein
MLANLLGSRIDQLLNGLDSKVLLIVVSLVSLALSRLLLSGAQNLLNFVVLQNCVFLRANAGELAAANRVIAILKFVRQNPVVLSFVQAV